MRFHSGGPEAEPGGVRGKNSEVEDEHVNRVLIKIKNTHANFFYFTRVRRVQHI